LDELVRESAALLVSEATSIGADVLFLFLPLTLAHSVLAEGRQGSDTQVQSPAAKRPM
jgi:hypothetical protein